MNAPTTPSLHDEGRHAARSPFTERLLAIRAQGSEASARRARARSAADVLASQELMQSYDFLESVEADAVALLEDLAAELPASAKLSRTFFDGRYQIVLGLEEARGEAGAEGQGAAGRSFSRLALLLLPQRKTGRFELEARMTVRNRDLEGMVAAADMDDAGRKRLADVIETCVLAFAQRWFEGGNVKRPDPAGTRPPVDWMKRSLDA